MKNKKHKSVNLVYKILEFMLFKSKKQMINLYLDALDTLKKQKEIIDKAIDKLNSFISCCRAEKLESGNDYLHHQYWDMFERFNKQVKKY